MILTATERDWPNALWRQAERDAEFERMRQVDAAMRRRT